MPMYDFKCEKCSAVHEQLVNAAITMVPCRSCIGPSVRQLSAPASIKMDDGTARSRRERIKEPMWLDPHTGTRTPVHP